MKGFIAVFDWSNLQNGRLIGFIGIISALLQGGYVRRAIPKVGEGSMARRGVASCIMSLILMSTLPHVSPATATKIMFTAAACLAFTSATVVNSLTSFASLQCDDGIQTKDENTGKIDSLNEPLLAKGRALGAFRSSGQLGRAIGPLLGKESVVDVLSMCLNNASTACASYWTFGPTVTYACSAAAMTALMFTMGPIVRKKSTPA